MRGREKGPSALSDGGARFRGDLITSIVAAVGLPVKNLSF